MITNKRFSGIALTVFCGFFSQVTIAAEPEMEHLARQKVSAFSSELKETLKRAMVAGGPTQGILVCRDEASKIASRHSGDGWSIKRKSDRNRNPTNKPDSWETKQIVEFRAALQGGATPDGLSATKSSRTGYRFAKPIVMDTVCLACHGTTLSEEVVSSLKQFYPQDMATGYLPGELRGIRKSEKKGSGIFSGLI